MPDVWAQSVQRASVNAVSLGFTHIQWLAGERRPENARYTTPVECNRTNYFTASYECHGGGTYDVAVAMLAIGRFVYLSAEEAKQREADSLIPADRRPIDARKAAGGDRASQR
jgi:hypothetical protein